MTDLNLNLTPEELSLLSGEQRLAIRFLKAMVKDLTATRPEPIIVSEIMEWVGDDDPAFGPSYIELLLELPVGVVKAQINRRIEEALCLLNSKPLSA